MSVNRIIAIDYNGKTKYLISALRKYDIENHKNIYEIETCDLINGAERFTKKQATGKIKILKEQGLFALMINPFEEGRVYEVTIEISEPNWINKNFSLKMNYWAKPVRFPIRTTYTHKNKILSFDKLENYLGKYNFKTKDDAKFFIDNNKELVFKVFKESLTLETY